MLPRSQKYRIRDGDSLVSIAKQQYGDASVWPDIARHNRLPANGLILVGKTLRLPAVFRPNTIPVGGGSAQPPKAARVEYPDVTFTFTKDVKSFTFEIPGFSVTLTFTGSISIQKVGTITEGEFDFGSDHHLTTTWSKKYKGVLAQLTAETHLQYDYKTKQAKLGGGLSVGVETKWYSLEATLDELTISVPPYKVSGTSKDKKWDFERDLGFELTLKPDSKPPARLPAPIDVPIVVPVSVPWWEAALDFLGNLFGDLFGDGVAIAVDLAPEAPILVLAAIRRSAPIPYRAAASAYHWPTALFTC